MREASKTVQYGLCIGLIVGPIQRGAASRIVTRGLHARTRRSGALPVCVRACVRVCTLDTDRRSAKRAGATILLL